MKKFFDTRKLKFRFDCGVVYDESSDQYFEFKRDEAKKLIELLSGADEIISHSGTRVDLNILRHACGDEALAPLWKIKHHDLLDLGNWKSLDNLSKEFCLDHVGAWKDKYARSWEEAREKNANSFIPEKLAKARYDVERTYAVFMKLFHRDM